MESQLSKKKLLLLMSVPAEPLFSLVRPYLSSFTFSAARHLALPPFSAPLINY
jgi:hypothetical protein